MWRRTMTTRTDIELQTVARFERTLSGAFYADQGALLRDDAGDPVTAQAAIEAVIFAAEHALHVPQRTARALGEAAEAVRTLPEADRGALVLALVTTDRPADCVDGAVRLGLLRGLLPDVDRLRAMPKGEGRYKDVYQHTLRVLQAAPRDAVTRLAALLHDIAKPDTLTIEDGVARFPNHDLLGADRAGRRLRGLGLPPALVSAVELLVRLHLRANSYEPSWTDSAVRRLRLEAGDHWQRLLDLSNADVTSARAEAVARARRRVRELAEHAQRLDRPVEVAPLDGNAMMARFGRGPGRWIGDLKRHLLGLVHDGTLDPEDEASAWQAAEAYICEHPNVDG